MATGYQALTEKEKQTLRLMVRGHDAKSVARHLGLSVHTVNERLRDARRKLQVSSSREAARLLFDTEEGGPENPADKLLGEARAAPASEECDRSDLGVGGAPGVATRVTWLSAGVVLMSGFLALLLLATAPQTSSAPSTIAAEAAFPIADTDIVRAARAWLTLHDEGRWRDSWNAAGASFRKLNSLDRWTGAAQGVRPPLGNVISRTAISQEQVPAPPAGVTVVKFRTRFANKADGVETVSLAREDGAWRVVGIYID